MPNELRERIPIDIKKLRKEDRRFLLEKNSSEVILNEQMLINNQILIISILALFVSLVSLVISSAYITIIMKIIFVTLMTILSIYLFISLFNARTKIKNDQEILKRDYNVLFRLHLNYGIKKGEN